MSTKDIITVLNIYSKDDREIHTIETTKVLKIYNDSFVFITSKSLENAINFLKSQKIDYKII